MKDRNRIVRAKLLRALGVTRPIELSEQERDWIRLIKGHYNDRYDVRASSWVNTLKPMFKEVYGWDPDEHYRDFLGCMFQKLLDIHLKIQLDYSGSNQQIKSVIGAGFERTYARDYELPVERVIAELCGQIQCNLVVEDGVSRYSL